MEVYPNGVAPVKTDLDNSKGHDDRRVKRELAWLLRSDTPILLH